MSVALDKYSVSLGALLKRINHTAVAVAIGIVEVAFLAAFAAGGPSAAITSTLAATKSATSAESCSR